LHFLLLRQEKIDELLLLGLEHGLHPYRMRLLETTGGLDLHFLSSDRGKKINVATSF